MHSSCSMPYVTLEGIKTVRLHRCIQPTTAVCWCTGFLEALMHVLTAACMDWCKH